MSVKEMKMTQYSDWENPKSMNFDTYSVVTLYIGYWVYSEDLKSTSCFLGC